MSLSVATGSVVNRGEGKQVWAFDMRIERKGHGVFEFESPFGCEIAPHVHREDDELHYLIDGSAVYTVGDQTLEAGPGSLIFLPRQVPHSLTFHGENGSRWLWVTRQENEGLFDEPIVIPVTEPDAKRRALEVPEDLVVSTFAKYGMDFLMPEEG
jgi:quercetin dioxygenase-like cupin family protein